MSPPCVVPLQGGPYHDTLHSILGAYTCYRPDVGYVSELRLGKVRVGVGPSRAQRQVSGCAPRLSVGRVPRPQVACFLAEKLRGHGCSVAFVML